MKSLIDKLVLGTVQFGLDYGVNNPHGKPDKKKSLGMLDYAHEKGIKIFDTAYNYGTAEEILGEFSESRKLKDKIQVITKLKPNIISKSKTGLNFYDIIRGNLEESLKRLGRDCVDGYLFHTPEYIKNDQFFACLQKLKREGSVKNIGVSIYEESDALYAAKLPGVDYIQIPYNIFDQRLDQTDFFPLARKNSKKIFARSAFLQGLFFMPEEKISHGLGNAKKYLKDLDRIISKFGMSRMEAALLFSLKNENVDYVVFGVDNIDQLKEDINIVEKNVDCKQCLDELRNKFIDIENSIIFQSLWKK